MRSRAARIASALIALIAIAAAAAFLYNSEKQINASTVALRSFDVHAREATDALADVRAGQQAYVAAGQGVAFWMPKVASTTDTVTTAVRALRQAAAGVEARTALDGAATTIAEFADIDKRARDYLKAGQPLMAGDVIFTEGAESAASASRQVESARVAEHQEFDQRTAQARKLEAAALGGAAGLAAIALLLLAAAPVETRDVFVRVGSEREPEAQPAARAPQPVHAPQPPQALQAPRSTSAGPLMKAAADLATDVGRVRDFDDLSGLLGRAAELMDASGVVVWIGSTSGADLRPVLAHGYAPQIVARMPAVPKSGDNAAAAAYRTGSLQLVLSRPGGTNGAIVAPILTADGCIGALSAEIRSGGETSETAQALAAIFAAQLANVIATAPAAEAPAAESKTASA